MLTLIEALHFRCLRYVRQPLEPFHVLVGPNGSGKTTFLDVPSLLGRLAAKGLDEAIGERTQSLKDLVWRKAGGGFELAIEARIPEERRRALGNQAFDTIRYEVALGTRRRSEEIAITAEKVLLKVGKAVQLEPRGLFPAAAGEPKTILSAKGVKGTRTVISRASDGNDSFYDETGRGKDHSFKLGPRKSALGNLPEDESKFPASTWLKSLLVDAIQPIALNSLALRRASPPGQVRGFKPDGSNLPWVVEALARRAPSRSEDWFAHVNTALTDLQSVVTVERQDDRHRYLVLEYAGGLRVPSWMASDGTLRLLALTLPAYLPDFRGVYLIEEPENGIHPRAVETLFQSLSSAYEAQILVATHSPVILSVASPKDVLCFAKTDDGATDIVRGDQHPALRDWRGETTLGVLFAGGVLG